MGSGGSKNKNSKKTVKTAGPVVPESKPTEVAPANTVRSRSPSVAVPEVPRSSLGQNRSPSIRAPRESRQSRRADDGDLFEDNDDANRSRTCLPTGVHRCSPVPICFSFTSGYQCSGRTSTASCKQARIESFEVEYKSVCATVQSRTVGNFETVVVARVSQ